ncbi:hypothetical protein H7849_21355 [Alloacidobacterium dinghuense]|uniref:Trypsin-like peptidase domain-containing protein n=1 Tax=Alloacidobacterium dinghuense TaxID=2763107 RepID=A0A7G8BGB8_9BACT|nr:hypothetical protein [Alloacidobacterium dinghuense]QNI31588.1 hypothetical protein H7849_21355 [Alloacidobacterium dinghuense]
MKILKVMISITLVLLVVNKARGDTVFIQAGEQTGVGITRTRGSECFVITAEHVLGVVQTVSIVGYRGVRSTGTKERSYAEDIAVLRVSGQGPDICGGQQWRNVSAASLRQSMRWQLEGSNGDGSVRIMDVALQTIDDRFLFVTSTRATDTIYEGMSGSLLKADGQPVGILIDVRRGNDGESGRAYRLDYLESTLNSFFAGGDPFNALYGSWQARQPDLEVRRGSCKQIYHNSLSVTLSPSDVEDGTLLGSAEQLAAFEVTNNKCGVPQGTSDAYVYRFQWVITPRTSVEFDQISKYLSCSGPSFPSRCHFDAGDMQGSLKVQGGTMVLTNTSGAATFQKR